MSAPQRDPRLQSFLDLTEAAILVNAASFDGAGAAAARIFTALRRSIGSPGDHGPALIPAVDSLDEALRLASLAPAPVSGLAASLVALAPSLCWNRRPGAEAEGVAFFNGHANAYVVGPQGLERRADVLVGISLMLPNLRYPNHCHPPEEVYVSLAGGSWWKSGREWHEPGPGGLVYNEPNVEHAMATGRQPLLAVWCLWAG